MQWEVSCGSLGHTEQQVVSLCIWNVIDPMLFSDVMFWILFTVHMSLEMQESLKSPCFVFKDINTFFFYINKLWALMTDI